jgi:hypothetical protein
VSVAGFHAAAEALNKPGTTAPSGGGQWRPTTAARSRSGLHITDTFDLIGDDLIAALNDEPGFVPERLTHFIRHVAVEPADCRGGQPHKASAESHQPLCQRLDSAVLSLEAHCRGKIDLARTVCGMPRDAEIEDIVAGGARLKVASTPETQVEPLRWEPGRRKRSP